MLFVSPQVGWRMWVGGFGEAVRSRLTSLRARSFSVRGRFFLGLFGLLGPRAFLSGAISGRLVVRAATRVLSSIRRSRGTSRCDPRLPVTLLAVPVRVADVRSRTLDPRPGVAPSSGDGYAHPPPHSPPSTNPSARRGARIKMAIIALATAVTLGEIKYRV